jgi:hypothetical protein
LGLQTRQGRAAEKEDTKNTQNYHGKGVLLKLHHPRCPLLRCSEAVQNSSSDLRHDKFQWQVPQNRKTECPGSYTAQKKKQSFRAPHINSQLLDDMLRVVTVVKQIMTDFNDAVSERTI